MWRAFAWLASLPGHGAAQAPRKVFQGMLMSETESKGPKIWVDADALPGVIREVLIRASLKREVDVVMVANTWIRQPKSAWVEVVTVSAGADVADDYIVEHCDAGDLVVTFDIPLAARAVEKKAQVVTPHGKVLDEANVTEALSFRDFSQQLRDVGIQTGGPSAFSDKDKQNFANALDRWITKNT